MIICQVMEEEYNNNNAVDQLLYIRDWMETTKTHRIFICIHNIDGSSIENYTDQNRLAQLSSIPGITIIASIDHYESLKGTSPSLYT